MQPQGGASGDDPPAAAAAGGGAAEGGQLGGGEAVGVFAGVDSEEVARGRVGGDKLHNEAAGAGWRDGPGLIGRGDVRRKSELVAGAGDQRAGSCARLAGIIGPEGAGGALGADELACGGREGASSAEQAFRGSVLRRCGPGFALAAYGKSMRGRIRAGGAVCATGDKLAVDGSSHARRAVG